MAITAVNIPVDKVPIRISVIKRSIIRGLEEYIKKFILTTFIKPKIRPTVNPLFNVLIFVSLTRIKE